MIALMLYYLRCPTGELLLLFLKAHVLELDLNILEVLCLPDNVQ